MKISVVLFTLSLGQLRTRNVLPCNHLNLQALRIPSINSLAGSPRLAARRACPSRPTTLPPLGRAATPTARVASTTRAPAASAPTTRAAPGVGAGARAGAGTRAGIHGAELLVHKGESLTAVDADVSLVRVGIVASAAILIGRVAVGLYL